MNLMGIAVLAVIAAIIAVTLRPKNAEIALMLGIAATVTVLLMVLSQTTGIIHTIQTIAAAANISGNYLAILFKAIGICFLTEFAANTCRDAGSQSLAGTVTLAGKIMVTVSALPLYADILNAVTGMLSG